MAKEGEEEKVKEQKEKEPDMIFSNKEKKEKGWVKLRKTKLSGV